jgi:ubiquinone biosynthesis protein
VTKVARRTRLLRVLREVGVVGKRPATREGAVRFRLALEELGTTYIKLGQLLSSRPDLLPDVYIEELDKLVDDVPPVPFAEIEPIILEDIGPVFARIDPEPLAAASIAQIHRAILDDGRAVVIKVRRPGIAEQTAIDLDLFRATVGFMEDHSQTAQMLQVNALADELDVHLRGELDLAEEAHNTELIAEMISRYDGLVVPRVIRPYVSERVLVLEEIAGEKVTADHGLDPERAAELARVLFQAYVHQVTIEGVYHADPHRGNILLTPDGRLALLDFGLLGRLDSDTRRSLALLLLAIAHNRADDVADLILGLSWTTLETDEQGFVQELRRKLPRYHWRPLSNIRTGDGLADVQRIALRHGLRLPTSFALVGKTLSQADSIARLLDPELDPVAQLRGDALSVMLEEAERMLSPDELLAYLQTQGESVLRLPRRVSELVRRLETGTLKIGVAPADTQEIERLARTTANRFGASIIICGLLISSALMARVNHAVSLAGFILGGVMGLYMLWKIIRTPGDL